MPDTSLKENISSKLAKIWNREFFVFVFLLVMSAAFWISMTLSEIYERDVKLLVVLEKVPRNVILLDKESDTITVNVRANGSTFLYKTMEEPDTVVVDFMQYKQDDKVFVSNNELHKLVKVALGNSVQVLSVKHDGLTFRFNYGEHKLLPVVFEGRVGSRIDKEISLSPDSVIVYAQPKILNQLKEIHTVGDSLNTKDDSVRNYALEKIKGVKCEPGNVQVRVTPVIFIENTIEVPVECVNEPSNKKLILFPSRVSVSYVVDIRKHGLIEKDLFRVEADYNEVADMTSQTCSLKLVSKPSFVKQAKLSIETSKYLIKER